MTTTDFEQCGNELFVLIDERGITKGKEYAPGADRLQNFKDIAALTGLDPLQVCYVLRAKHEISIRDIIMGEQEVTEEVWEEKLGDMLVYSFCLNALMRESSINAMRAMKDVG
jgi:hypothetical protein